MRLFRSKQKKILEAIRELEEKLAKLKQDSISNDSRVQKAQQQLVEAERLQREARGRLLNVPPPPPPPDDEDKAELKKRELEIQEIIAEMKRIESKIADKKKKPDQSISILYSKVGGGGAFVAHFSLKSQKMESRYYRMTWILKISLRMKSQLKYQRQKLQVINRLKNYLIT